MAAFAELQEADARGELAQIYAHLRDTYGVHYVSSLQRHFATYPGVLQWSWGIVAPAFHNGLIPQTAARLAQQANQEQPLVALSVEALRDLGVDEAGEREIRNICANFIHVAPINILFASCIRALLAGAPLPNGASIANRDWPLPDPLPALPSMCDSAELAPAQQTSMRALSTLMGKQVFTPGLYRMIAHWPAYLDHVAAELGPRMQDAGFRARGENLAQQIASAAPAILSALPAPAPLPAPSDEIKPALLAAIATYRRTSPEMVTVGSLLLNALPAHN